MANSVDPDQSDLCLFCFTLDKLLQVYFVCPGLSVRKLRIITVIIVYVIFDHLGKYFTIHFILRKYVYACLKHWTLSEVKLTHCTQIWYIVLFAYIWRIIGKIDIKLKSDVVLSKFPMLKEYKNL